MNACWDCRTDWIDNHEKKQKREAAVRSLSNRSIASPPPSPSPSMQDSEVLLTTSSASTNSPKRKTRTVAPPPEDFLSSHSMPAASTITTSTATTAVRRNNAQSHGAEAFQFHCMICFEEFENSPQRYPVVLPCGHTYVCRSCGDRLDKCMECREPLFMTFSAGEFADATNSNNNNAPSSPPFQSANTTPPPNSVSRSTWASARSGRYTTPLRSAHRSEQKTIKKRLPLPKNAVLLSLIETTKLISGDDPAHGDRELAGDGTENLTMSAEDSLLGEGAPHLAEEDEDGENQRARLAASVSAGIAGTYTVSIHEGLQIFPTRPVGASPIINGADEDVDTLVQFFHSDKLARDQQFLEDVGGGSPTTPEMAHLAYGDRVQVVSMDGGWAKLARGYGFVRADKNQIVKVMNALDRACILEAMLRTLSERRRDLRAQQSENDTQFIKLMNQLQASLQSEEDFTVICRTAFCHDENEEDVVSSSDSMTEKKEDYNPENPAEHEDEERQVIGSSSRGSFGNVVVPLGATTLTAIEPNVAHSSNHMASSSSNNHNNSSATTSAASPSPSEMRAGAQAWRERQAREVQKSINFRSGLSGHMALASNRAHAHEFVGSPRFVRAGSDVGVQPSRSSPKGRGGAVGPRITNFRMSSHSGLTMSHRKKPRSQKMNMDFISLSGSM